MANWLDRILKTNSKSADEAKERLKLVLIRIAPT